MKPKIAYVMSRFPHLPETFILREMDEIERHDWQVALYPLVKQTQSVVHAEAESWLNRVRHLPFISRAALAANGRSFFQNPFRYLALLFQVVWENIPSPKFLSRALVVFPKAVYAAQLMQKEGVTHIHAHYASHPALFAWIIRQFTGINYSVTVHAHDIFVQTVMLKTKLQDAAFIVAISEYNRRHLARIIGQSMLEKTVVIHCGIVPQNYTPLTKRLQKDERLEIISIGSLQPYKGQRHLIDACARLRDRGIPFRCRIIGEGELRSELESMIAASQLKSQFQLLGSKTQREVAELLAEAHCYVQPSIITSAGKMEGIPVSLMEALACRLPVVATALSGIPELVRPNETGCLVPPGNAEALANAIEDIYSDFEYAVQLAENGRQLVLQEFDLRANVDQLSRLFDRFLLHQPTPTDLRTFAAEH